MRLRRCPDCENKVSKRAKSCPHCGCPFNDGPNMGLFALEVATGPFGCLPFLGLILSVSALPFVT